MIIHISGTPGSGKTTLGEQLKEKYKDKIIVYDTDEFIQHHNKAGKKLSEIEKSSTVEEYKKAWLEILGNEINKFISKHPNRIIVFTGILSNFSPDDTIYEIQADHKYRLNVPLNEIMRRYYMRLCNDEKNRTNKKSNEYWNKVADDVYHISSSKDITYGYNKDVEWHNKHGYELKTANEIMIEIGKIITDINNGGYYEKYKKYKSKYLSITK